MRFYVLAFLVLSPGPGGEQGVETGRAIALQRLTRLCTIQGAAYTQKCIRCS